MTEQRINKLKKLLELSRDRIADSNILEFSTQIYYITFVATKNVYRISTNGTHIFFNPDWLQRLSNEALDFIIIHQILHIRYQHVKRSKLYRGEKYHLACDIVIDAKLYDMGFKYKKLSGLGEIRTETYYPVAIHGSKISAEQAFDLIPFDPATLPITKRRAYMIDSDEYWGEMFQPSDEYLVVLEPSLICENIDFENAHSEILDFFTTKKDTYLNQEKRSRAEKDFNENVKQNFNDRDLKIKIQAIRSDKSASQEYENSNSFRKSIIEHSQESELDWKQMLNIFIQNNVYDYSFFPPDRRFNEADFFMPDLNSSEISTKEILFMVDTSASIKYQDFIVVYAEICSAIEQFDASLNGRLGFFDSEVKPIFTPLKIDSVVATMPIGGGGTDFRSVFNYVNKNLRDDPLSTIVIFTDGNGVYPDISDLINVPVLWIINNKEYSPPFGQIVRMKI